MLRTCDQRQQGVPPRHEGRAGPDGGVEGTTSSDSAVHQPRLSAHVRRRLRGAPIGDYTPDFLPLIDRQRRRSLSGRLTLHFQARPGWFVRGTGAYTWRATSSSPARLLHNGQLFFSDRVAMPDVFDYTASAGYLDPQPARAGLFHAAVHAGRGRHPSAGHALRLHRANFSKVGALVQYWFPRSGPSRSGSSQPHADPAGTWGSRLR